jgi:3'(2'), 5'-bisphosphate nucleotidase
LSKINERLENLDMTSKCIPYEKELHAAMNLAVEAGSAIMDIYEKGFGVEYKEDKTPVTDADLASEHIITNGLKKSFPGYAILSEETEDDRSRLENDLCFIVDPLDGTKEFVKRNGEFVVNIALSFRHEAVLGVIYIPVTKELFYAVKGSGAFLRYQGKDSRLKVSDKTSDIRMAVSRSYHSDKLPGLIKRNNIKNIITVGSAIKGCLVARGGAEVYYRFGRSMEWDTAAMQCIVEEAGGIFRQMDDTRMYYNRPDSLNAKGFYVINRLENLLILN